MRHLFLFLSIVFISNTVFSQNEFNKWSIEANLGVNKPMGPLTGGYLSPTLNIGHVDFGGRYMVNQFYGFSGNFGFGSFSEAKDVSPEFKTDYLSLSLSGVWNIGRSLSFETFTKRFTVLGEFGVGIGSLKSENRINSEGKLPDFDPDYVYSFNSSLKGLYSLSNRISLQGTISMIVNGRQRYTFDGNDFNQIGRPLVPEIPFVHATATWWTGTVGLNFYLGKNETHADWYIQEDKYATKEELASQIGGIKDMLKDSDGDGVPDYLDKEPNTPAGARVNSFGTTMDSDGDGTPDHLDKCPFLPGPSSTGGCPVEKIVEQVDYLRKAINDGFVNVYYAFDSDKPLGYSTSAANYVSNFLKKNPGVSVEVKGYADELGPEDYNMKLSERRAKAVYDLLVASGVDASRISYKGYGEDTSVDKSSADARQMARRASFEVK
ncbi:OmpA family protein [Algoriphagus marinus]|uniref:OmpA family protein n=1 Tax=Algoriphagus marinus TaxID=1925762 RepID=UPI00094BC147|nr:OmpA family protein [Algoriphagus marinus]